MPVGSISFPVTLDPVTVSSKVEVRSVPPAAGVNGSITEFWGDIKGGAVAQVNTLTLTLGDTGNVYAVSISTGLANDPEIYSVVQEAGDTLAILAARLAKDLNNDSRIEAKSTAGVITTTGTVSGQAITISANPETLTTTPSNLVLALTTAASGTSVYRKLMTVSTVFGVSSTGNPTASITTTYHNGDANNTAISGASVVERIHPKTFQTIRTENSIT